MRDGTITLGQAAAWCGGTVAPRFAETAFHGANFDTRRLQAGELFVALVGARNGHAFARAAMEQGAAGVLASEALDADIPAIYVQDTEIALQAIAKQRRAQLSLRCVGITGSVGKTTTKEMIAAVLETTFVTRKTAENFNNGIGLPVTVLGLGEDCEAAVLEMGMNHFGEISALTRIAQPDIAVITNIGTMHIENLGSREGILRAKLEILEGLPPNGIAVFNGDDPLLRREAAKYHAVTFGCGEDNTVRAREVRVEETQTSFTASGFGEAFAVTLPVSGEHYVSDALAAITVGLQCGVPPEKIAAALAGFHNTGMRQKRYDRDGLHIIEDCYNAGPESMRAALKVLQGARGRRIAVLGGMLELGDFAPQAHYEIGQAAANAADILLAYGANSEEYVRGAKAAGMNAARCFPTHEALTEALRGTVRPQDTLLVKGSRGMKMERVLQLLFDKSKIGG
ncbi:MAG: UDP-N-acetylmuramoyl-tripeptide--D-alanyl-D-alanine ligase [Faecousia sp.]